MFFSCIFSYILSTESKGILKIISKQSSCRASLHPASATGVIVLTLCVCPCVCVIALLANKQTYRLEFWYVGQMEGYLGQVWRSRSKVKVTRLKKTFWVHIWPQWLHHDEDTMQQSSSWDRQLRCHGSDWGIWLQIRRSMFSKHMSFFFVICFYRCTQTDIMDAV